MAQDTTIDGLLDRRVALEQPAKGYRVAVDTVLLAAAVPAQAGDKVLELGSGVGGAMLCLASRMPELSIIGVEIDNEILLLAASNIARNTFATHCKLRHADATRLPHDFPKSFDHVFMNPPYHEASRHDASPKPKKKKANSDPGDLSRWIASAATALKPNATLTLIHRADRRDEILGLLQPAFGAIEILPTVPKKGDPPHRIVIRARKSKDGQLVECVNFVLHQADGSYTAEAENILRHMKLLPFEKAR